MKTALQLVLISIAINCTCLFGLVSRHHSIRQNFNQIRFSQLYLSSKDDEIAELEEKLRKLKQEAATKGRDRDNESSPLTTVMSEPLDEMLTEKWKENETESVDNSGFIKNLVGFGIMLLISIAVSQIPTGQQEYDKYTAVKPNTSIDLGDLNPAKSIQNGK